MTAAEVLAAWQATADGATEGPWTTHNVERAGWFVETPESLDAGEYPAAEVPFGNNAAFIALSRDALPRAVAALQAVLALADAVADNPRTAQWVHRNRIQDAINTALGVEP